MGMKKINGIEMRLCPKEMNFKMAPIPGGFFDRLKP